MIWKQKKVAEILKDKPQRTILYDYLHNIDVEFDNVETTEIKTSIWCTRDKGGYNELFGYSKLGTLRGWLDGLQILLPSKQMRDWRKFAWKKGDVLVSTDRNVHIIFEKFEDDAYTKFRGKHYLWEEGGSMVSFEENECYMQTSDFNKANKEDAQEYIHKIEKILGGKLNRETLEIEKAQPEFKDGDIVCISGMGYFAYGIVKSIDNSSKKLEYYVLNDMSTLKFEDWLSFEDKQIQPISETQQIILFEALAKEDKAWDAEKKAIVNLPKKSEFKIFQKVLVRNYNGEEWIPGFFFRIHNDGCRYILVCGEIYKQCIPYNDHTEHLLGTTDEWKGGEQ